MRKQNLLVFFFVLVAAFTVYGQQRVSPETVSSTAVRDRTSQNWCINCEQGLSDARAALAAAGSTAVNVVLMGDSISAGANGTTTDTDGYAWRVKRELERRFGKGLDESLWVYNTLSAGDGSRWQKIVNGSDSWNPGGSVLNFGGIRGYAWTDTGTSANLRVANLYGTGVEIYYVRNPSTTAQWSYKVDGGSAVNVSQSATGSLAAAVVERVQITGLSLQNHTIDIFGPASGKVSITGIASIIGTTGVRFHNWSQSGYTSNQWLGTPAGEPADNRAAAFAAVQPKLLILACGVNDAGGTPNLATYESNLAAAIAAQTYGSVLLLWPNPTPSGANETVRRQYFDVMLKLVHANPTKVALLNGYDFFGGTIAAMAARGFTPDNLHPGPAGHRALAQLVLSAIAPSADSGARAAKNGGTTVGPRQRINFIEGSNVTLTVGDDGPNDEIDVTIAASGGSSLTVREVDGTPSLTATTIETNQAVGLTVTDQGSGVARVSLASVPDSALATISTAGKVADSALSANVSLLGSAIDLSGAEATGTLAAGRFPALTGDVTTTAGSLATTVANNAISFAKFTTVATDKLVGRDASGTGNAGEIGLAGSLTFTGSDTIQLSGDAASPGNTKLYGTNGSGVKGWYDQPAGGTATVTELFVSETNAGNGATTGSDVDLSGKTYTVPANTLSANGQRLKARFLIHSISASALTIKIWFGGTVIFTPYNAALNLGNNFIEVEVDIVRRGASSVYVFGKWHYGNNPTGSTLSGMDGATYSPTLSDSNVIKITFNSNSQNGADCEMMAVTKYAP